MRNPEEEAVRANLFEWRDAIEEREKLDQKFLKESLLALVEGMLSLDERFASLNGHEWRLNAEIVKLQDELNHQRHKMIILQKTLEEGTR